MALVSEDFNEQIIRHYSDSGFKIRQLETGKVYEEAYDLKPCKYSYTETDEPVQVEDGDTYG